MLYEVITQVTQGSQMAVPGFLFAHQQYRRGSVGQGAGVAHRDRAGLVIKVGAQFCKGFQALFPARPRITSYNVCYTKLLRSIYRK